MGMDLLRVNIASKWGKKMNKQNWPSSEQVLVHPSVFEHAVSSIWTAFLRKHASGERLSSVVIKLTHWL